MNNLSESSLYKPILKYFNPEFDTYAEVYFSRRMVDLVFLKKQEDLIIAVELKVRDWRGALRQAIVNQLFADKSYVVLSRRNEHYIISDRIKGWFREFGVGLIVIFKGGIEIVIQSECSNFIIDDKRADILTQLNKASVKNLIPREEFENGTPAKPPRTIAFLPAGTY